jgi:hypothetical protein
MPKQYTWENGVKVGEIDIPDPPTPQPKFLDKAAFLAWFDATFGANATPTRTQIANTWPTQ